MRHLLSITDLRPDEMKLLIKNAIAMKKNPKKFSKALAQKTLLMIFEKPSLRTRVSFETGMTQLGGHAIYYDVSTSPMGKGETVGDTTACASRYADLIMGRIRHDALVEMTKTSRVPIINALSELEHPCQILSDYMTIFEKKKTFKTTISFVGDGNNNITHSLILGAALLGANIRVGCPAEKDVMPNPEILAHAKTIAKKSGSVIEIVSDPITAVKDADVVYADTWVSYYTPPEEKEKRIALFKPYQITTELLSHAKKDVSFMHNLPALRGMEVTANVIDGKHSIVFDQAENRLHAQKALMVWLLKQKNV
ncbi:MAG: ornithine carbamoyltransferase [Candidatus Aenigmarchaeota archaeon]|nr:ornithine carbamoyltransferase [Candidatus Aenigmarchaeota archaeon]